ncbi:hypothetical protein D9V32_04265 [Mycetocola tolaasinivorans]|uniref:Uncharacterized protein n=1 Tax=Mycetocola tolaasinivorans TaxID=76635 RepID=A0A3L7AAL2_9MICO|nr:hypothetical protein [Mycetocola tolaasinivorans]RLP76858.1 hypothetical protein D9V32_04265 [Mycetocola tolaasinivorans]
MAEVIPAHTQSGGLGSKQARWVFLFVWACNVWLGLMDGDFSPLDPINATAYAAALVGCLLLTTPGRLPLTAARSTMLVISALYLVAVTLLRAPDPAATELLYFAAYLVGFVIPRGNPRVGAIGSTLVIGGIAVWGVAREATAGEFAVLLGVPIGCVVAAAAWRMGLQLIVRRERDHRSVAARAAENAAAADEAVRISRRELAEIRAEVAPLLEEIVRGTPIDAAMRVALVRTEAAIRDRIRAPHLQHPALVAAFALLRDRGVTVVVLGEPTVGGGMTDTLAEAVVELVREVTAGRVTVRSLPSGRRSALSVVLQGGAGSEQILLSASGTILSRG